jgi:hypothetical protein
MERDVKQPSQGRAKRVSKQPVYDSSFGCEVRALTVMNDNKNDYFKALSFGYDLSFFSFIIHMCIQGLGHFSPLPPPPPLPPTPPPPWV